MAALLAVVLGMGGQTFAKYITTNTVPTQQATVAKWGFVITNTVTDDTPGTPLFNEGDGTSIKSEEFSNDSVLRNVVAPGTNGEMSVEINGVAEVKAKIETTFAVSKQASLKIDALDKTYYPIRWGFYVDGVCKAGFNIGTDALAGSYWTNDATAISTYVSGMLATEYSNIAPGTQFTNKTFTVKWNWPYSYDETADLYDTALGLHADGKTYDAAYSNPSLDIEVNMGVTITQLD